MNPDKYYVVFIIGGKIMLFGGQTVIFAFVFENMNNSIVNLWKSYFWHILNFTIFSNCSLLPEQNLKLINLYENTPNIKSKLKNQNINTFFSFVIQAYHRCTKHKKNSDFGEISQGHL